MLTQGPSASGADDGIRTRDPHLGKVVLYQLSHVRACSSILGAWSESFNRLLGQLSIGRTDSPLRGDQSMPVEPNPPSPRPLSGRSSAQVGTTDGMAITTSCAIRSPVRISTASFRSRFTTEQI